MSDGDMLQYLVQQVESLRDELREDRKERSEIKAKLAVIEEMVKDLPKIRETASDVSSKVAIVWAGISIVASTLLAGVVAWIKGSKD